jgi:hypothetical protein
VRGNSETERAAMERRRNFDHRVADLVREAQADNYVRADIDPGLLVRLVFGMSNSLVEWYRPDGRMPASAIAEAVEKIVFQGVDGPDAQA